MTRLASALIFAAVLIAPAFSSARELVSIKLRGVYFSEPANVQVIVAVEPDPQNRKLRLEADSDSMFRSSEVDLAGDNKRLYTIELKNLPAGDYMLRAELFSAQGV